MEWRGKGHLYFFVRMYAHGHFRKRFLKYTDDFRNFCGKMSVFRAYYNTKYQ